MRSLLPILFAILVSLPIGRANPAFPLLGLWQVASTSERTPDDPINTEWLFRPDGQIVITGMDRPDQGPTELVSYLAQYQISGADSFEFSPRGDYFDHFTFTFKGDCAFLHCEKTKADIVLRHIEKSQFKGTPKLIK